MIILKKIPPVLLFLSIAANVLLGVFIFARYSGKASTPDQKNTSEFYSFLSPRIFAENQNDMLINFVPLRKKMNEYANSVKDQIGVYFEYLPSGISIGINEKEGFIPASLLKVPLAMGVYKQIEKGSLSLSQKLTVSKEDIDPSFGDFWRKGAGTEISADEAIRLMLIESDNTAKNALFHHVPQGTLEDVFQILDIPIEFDKDTSVVTPKNYSSVLRSLYLSSYLSKDDSNKLLNLLTQSRFTDKIVSGVPKNIKAAHKIGVANPKIPGLSIYTDCGIIYVPNRPYVLCVMVQGSEENARLYMSNFSRIIYDYISSVNHLNK